MAEMVFRGCEAVRSDGRSEYFRGGSGMGQSPGGILKEGGSVKKVEGWAEARPQRAWKWELYPESDREAWEAAPP